MLLIPQLPSSQETTQHRPLTKPTLPFSFKSLALFFTAIFLLFTSTNAESIPSSSISLMSTTTEVNSIDLSLQPSSPPRTTTATGINVIQPLPFEPSLQPGFKVPILHDDSHDIPVDIIIPFTSTPSTAESISQKKSSSSPPPQAPPQAPPQSLPSSDPTSPRTPSKEAKTLTTTPSPLVHIISRTLSLTIVIFSGLLKVPQLKNILATRTGTGLSLGALYLDLFSYTSNAMYSYLIEAPITTYAEHFIISLQVVAIIALVWHYGQVIHHGSVNNSNFTAFHRHSNESDDENDDIEEDGHIVLKHKDETLCSKTKPIAEVTHVSTSTQLMMIMSYIIFIYIAVTCLQRPAWTLLIIFSSSLSIISKITQMVQNYIQQHTGVLSIITLSLQIGGSLARAFTTIVEVGDNAILISYLLTCSLNVIIFFQILCYWDASLRANNEATALNASLGSTSTQWKRLPIHDIDEMRDVNMVDDDGDDLESIEMIPITSSKVKKTKNNQSSVY